MPRVPDVCVPLSQELLATPTRILEHTFPNAAAVVVQDRLSGFRNNKPVHVFLVEVIGGDDPGTYIVKIGPSDELLKELRGWEECKPVGLRHDLLFLPLRKGFRCDQARPWGHGSTPGRPARR